MDEKAFEAWKKEQRERFSNFRAEIKQEFDSFRKSGREKIKEGSENVKKAKEKADKQKDKAAKAFRPSGGSTRGGGGLFAPSRFMTGRGRDAQGNMPKLALGGKVFRGRKASESAEKKAR
jgi:hypothetical protein|tara:strand:- start:409 stop:768 length:360 start_codon:yes stop_codon:yes gene_type:complete